MQDIESLDLYVEVQKALLKLLPDNQSQAHLLKLVAIGERLLSNRQEQVSLGLKCRISLRFISSTYNITAQTLS